MKYNILLICGLFISFSAIYGQNPQSVEVFSTPDGPETCTDTQNAGTVSGITTYPTTQSNSITLIDTSFLCANDSALVIHRGDFSLLGDPDPNTPGEVGYAFYNCTPSIIGDELGGIVADPCLITDPPPAANGIWISRAMGPGDANLKLFNDGAINNLFSGGDPTYFILAPITFDVFNGNPAFENNGSCVNVSINQAFELVYLNPIELISSNTSGLSGSFRVSGGYPEFNGSSSYTNIEIINDDDNSITGTLTSGSLGPGDLIEFTVPVSGDYTVIVEDEKACPLSFPVTFSDQAVELNVGDATVGLGDSFCLPITVSNFDSVTSVTFVVNFDPNVLEYVDLQNFAFPGDAAPIIGDNQAENGLVRFIWFANDLEEGQTLSDGSVFIELCFTTAPGASVGDESIVDLIGNGPTDIEITGKGGFYDVNVNSGLVIIEANGLTPVAASCGSLPGRTDGSITVTGFSGVPPYQVNISGPQNDNGPILTEGGSITFNDLPPGMYTITITDDNGDMSSTTQEVYDGGVNGLPRPNYNFSFIENPRCFDSDDGSLGITITPNPDAEPFLIEWSTNEFNVDTLENLTRGTYRVTVTDNFGCEEERNQTLTQSQIQISANITNPGCSGYSDGEAIITASGGTPNGAGEYQYSWTVGGGGVTTGTDANITGIPEGWFSVEVRDDNNCLFVDSFFVTADRTVTYDVFAINPPTCFEGQDGSIRVSGQTLGGPANDPYSIQILDDLGTDLAVPFGPSVFRAGNLEAGFYNIIITDQTMPNACVFDTIVELIEPEPITVGVMTSDETCLVGNDGTATLTPEGGTPPYNYLWPGGLPNSSSQSNLPPGDYSIIVSDINGCSETVDLTINEAMPPEFIEIIEVPPTCPESCDGTITIVVEPNPNFEIVRYRVRLGPGQVLDTLTNETMLTIGGFCSGQLYSLVQIEDEAGCIHSPMPVPLGEFPERDSLELDTIITVNPSCNSFSDGSVEVRLLGGEMPYIYSWNDGQVDTINGPGIRNDLADGSYTVTVNDINDCGTLELSFELEEPDPLNVQFDNIMDASCFNTCDGSAQATGSGGPTDPSGYTFTWNSGFSTSGNPSSVANDLCPDEAFVILSSDICTDTFSVNIPAPDAITNQVVDSVPPSCFGDANGSLEVAASGGNGGFTYQWQGGPQNTRYSNLEVGTYIVEITDALNCTLIDTISLNEPDSLIAFFEPGNVLNPSCPGETDGMLTVSVDGGFGPNYIYDWQDGISQSNEASGLEVGTYEVTVSDANGCSDTTSATLFTNPPISFVLPQPDTPVCNGETVLFQIDSISGGSGGPYQYQFPGTGFVDLGQAVPVSEGNQALTIIDGNGCSIDTSIDVPTRQAIEITLAPDQEIRLGESLQLFPVISGPFPIVNYQWSPSEGLSCFNCPNPEVTPGGNTTYTLIVTDANGCTAAAITNIRTNTQRDIYIPNVFSPNGDEINDVFRVFSGPGVDLISSFQVFDRWGGLMWEGRNLLPSGEGSPGWNGRRNGQSAPVGVYAYKIDILFIDGRVITYRGDVTIVR